MVEFEFFPARVKDLWPIYFDVTRRINNTREGMTTGSNSFSELLFKSYPGSRCSDKVPWVHNRCLKLWSDDPNDSYSLPNQRYRVLDAAVTHSMPTRVSGNGNGKIEIQLLKNVVSDGYYIEFIDNNIAELYNSSSLVSSVGKVNGKWEFKDKDKIEIIIIDNPEEAYQSMDVLYFSVLVSSQIFNNIKIE